MNRVLLGLTAVAVIGVIRLLSEAIMEIPRMFGTQQAKNPERPPIRR